MTNTTIPIPHATAALLRGLLCTVLLLLGQNALAADATTDLYSLPYSWQQDDGATVRLEHWRGRPLLLAMAFTTCRETCSYTLHRLQQIDKAAKARGQQVDIVVVSYDPKNDDAAAWSLYRRRHHLQASNWHFLSGSDEATQVLAKALHSPFWVYDEHVMHEFRVTLLNGSGRIDGVLTWANRNDRLLAAN
jgi:protein SCO1/2